MVTDGWNGQMDILMDSKVLINFQMCVSIKDVYWSQLSCLKILENPKYSLASVANYKMVMYYKKSEKVCFLVSIFEIFA